MLDNLQSILGDASNQQRSADDSNMIPLINIVFLMLIFFMVAGKISATDRAEFEAPVTTFEGQQPQDSLSVIVDSQQNLWIDNQQLGQLETLDTAAWQELETHLVTATAVTLKLDAELPAKAIDDLLEVLRKNNLKKIQLAIQQSPVIQGLKTS